MHACEPWLSCSDVAMGNGDWHYRNGGLMYFQWTLTIADSVHGFISCCHNALKVNMLSS